MGTRNLVAVKINDQYKIAQYGQWDGYPSGQGKTILDFLNIWDREVFTEKVKATSFYTDDELDKLWKQAGSVGGMIDYQKAKDFQAKMPEISRDTGAKILLMVHAAPAGLKLQNNLGFASDSLFCEWGYVIDLDANTLEIFRGFNKSPLTIEDRFYNLTSKEDVIHYHPIRLMASYSLDDIPTQKKMEEDCSEHKGTEDEE